MYRGSSRPSSALPVSLVCAHERECGTTLAADCDALCECGLREVFVPAFGEVFYGCRLATACGALDDESCIEEVDRIDASETAERVIDSCFARCAGYPCELFKVYRDDVLEPIEPCLARGDCVTCFEQATLPCP